MRDTQSFRALWLILKADVNRAIDNASDSKSKHDDAQSVLNGFTEMGQGEFWTHYKGGVYQTVTLAVKEDTLEPVIVYRSLKHGSVWVRTLDNWFDMVTLADGSRVHRFKYGAP